MSFSKTTKIIIATIIVIGGFAIFYFFQNKSDENTTSLGEFNLPESFFVDDETEIKFEWTDENKDEDLIIQSDKKSYFGINKSEIYFSVSNINKDAQNFNLRFLFGEESVKLEKIEKISSGGTPSELSLSENTFVKFDSMDGFSSSLYVEDTIQPEQTNYYKATITYNPNTKGEFYIEAKGDKGAYGLLDPWYNSTGLVGYWSMDGNDVDWSATTAEVIDRSGQGNHGDAISMDTSNSVIGKVGQAMDFRGGGYINIPSSSVFDFTGQDSFSLGVWLNIDSSLGDYDGIIGKASASSIDGYMLRHTTNGNISARLEDVLDSNQAGATSSGYDYRDGQWHHVFMVVDRVANKLSLYIDGAIESQDADIIDIDDIQNDYNLNIGSFGTGVKLNGKIDEARIYNRALSPDEITELYNMGAKKFKIR